MTEQTIRMGGCPTCGKQDCVARSCALLQQKNNATPAVPALEGECPNLVNCNGACFQCEYYNAETGATVYPAVPAHGVQVADPLCPYCGFTYSQHSKDSYCPSAIAQPPQQSAQSYITSVVAWLEQIKKDVADKNLAHLPYVENGMFHKDITDAIDALNCDHYPAQPETVKVPQTASEAKTMLLLGTHYLTVHAPHELKAQEVQPTFQRAYGEDYLDGVNVDRLERALTQLGVATCGREEMAARMAWYVNDITSAVMRHCELFQSKPVEVQSKTLERAHELGFLRCAGWAQRNDLFSDVSSPAYHKDRLHDLATITVAQPEPYMHRDYPKDPLEALHDVFLALPICSLLGVVGDAIQEIQSLRQVQPVEVQRQVTQDEDRLFRSAAMRSAKVVGKGKLVEVQPVRFPESIVREKARLHVQSGHSYRGDWCTNTELAMQVLELGFRSGFRSAEAAHGIKPASEGGAA